jgi:hypothetical protein
MTTIGQTIRISASWTAGGIAAEPGSVDVSVESPDGTITTPSPTNTATGADHVDLQVTESGRWTVRFAGTDPVPTAAEITIDVDPSPFY